MEAELAGEHQIDDFAALFGIGERCRNLVDRRRWQGAKVLIEIEQRGKDRTQQLGLNIQCPTALPAGADDSGGHHRDLRRIDVLEKHGFIIHLQPLSSHPLGLCRRPLLNTQAKDWSRPCIIRLSGSGLKAIVCSLNGVAKRLE